MNAETDVTLIAIDKFIQATRDSGYRGTSSAVAELIDNSLQAGATVIDVCLLDHPERSTYPVDVYIIDNGEGMTASTLRQALRFGGSSRFGDREGLGRYGMGLPNSSLSQARRLEVYTWRGEEVPLFSYLDVDEIAQGGVTEVPKPKRRALPEDFPWSDVPASGTLVVWTRCDRLENKRSSTNSRKLAANLGRRLSSLPMEWC